MKERFDKIYNLFLRWIYIKTSATCFSALYANCMYTDYITIRNQISYIYGISIYIKIWH